MCKFTRARTCWIIVLPLELFWQIVWPSCRRFSEYMLLVYVSKIFCFLPGCHGNFMTCKPFCDAAYEHSDIVCNRRFTLADFIAATKEMIPAESGEFSVRSPMQVCWCEFLYFCHKYWCVRMPPKPTQSGSFYNINGWKVSMTMRNLLHWIWFSVFKIFFLNIQLSLKNFITVDFLLYFYCIFEFNFPSWEGDISFI